MAETSQTASVSAPAQAPWVTVGLSDEELATLSVLERTLNLERISISFDSVAGAILGRIHDKGHATCADLAEWFDSPEEWIAFSRLQRARLLYDAGSEFTVSREGREWITRLLGEDSE